MSADPKTDESLLLRVRDPSDAIAWNRFDAIYRPMVYRIARRRGWQDSDAEDLAQRVLLAVSKAIPEWEKNSDLGSFRAWLSTIARNTLINMLRATKPDASVGGTDFFRQGALMESGEAEIDVLIRQEHDRACLRTAAEQIRGEFKTSTWNAFWLTTLEQKSVEAAAAKLGISTGSVYAARSRVMRRLQQQVKSNELEDA